MSALQTEILLAVQGLGSTDSVGQFHVNEEATDRLKEIDKLLHKDTPEKQYVHFYLGQKQALQSHVVPLVLECQDDAAVIFLCLKIFVRLTLPLPPSVENYLQRLTQLHDAKQALISGGVIAALIQWMRDLFSSEPSERTWADNDSLELFCSLFKNLLAIPNPSRASASSLSESDLNLQDRCILKLGEEFVLDALVTLAQGCSEKHVVNGCEGVRRSVTLMLLQCFYHLFKNETEEDLQGGSMSSTNVDLAKASKGVSSEKDALVNRLMIHQKKQMEENFLRSRGQSSRHSRFGTLIVQSSQLGARPQLVRNVFSANDLATDLYTDDGSSRKPCPDVSPRAYFNDRVRQLLYETAEQLLVKGAYNELMSSMLNWLQSESARAYPEDAMCFIHLGSVLMGVHRLIMKKKVRKAEKKKVKNVGFTIKDVSASLSKEAFDFLFARIQTCFASKPIDYPSLAICMSNYKEIVRIVYECTFHGDEETKLEASEMRQILFDNTDHVKILPQCFKFYTAQRNNQRHLTNLVHSAHFSIRVLTYMAKTGHKVQAKRRKKPKKSINSNLMEDLEEGYAPAPKIREEEEEEGTAVAEEGEEVKKTKKNGKKSGKKAKKKKSVDNDEEEQADQETRRRKEEEEGAVEENRQANEEETGNERVREEEEGEGEIRRREEGEEELEGEDKSRRKKEKKRRKEREKREELTEEQTEASKNPTQPEEEAEKADRETGREEQVNEEEGDEQKEEKVAAEEEEEEEQPKEKSKKPKRKKKEVQKEEEWEIDEEEGFEEEYSRTEHAFNLDTYVSGYVHHQIIRSYCQLLSHYKVNSLETNGCILKFFELICAEPYRMSALFFQLSVLVLFDQILNDETIHHDKNFAALRQFCKNVVRRLLDLSVDNPLLFMEVLWPKTPQFAEQLLEPFKVMTSQELAELREERENRKEFERQMEDEADMEEAGFNEGTTWVPKPQPTTASGAPKVRWSKADDALLMKEYPALQDQAECLEMLGSLFLPPREEAAVKRRLKALGLTGVRRDQTNDYDSGEGQEQQSIENGEEGESNYVSLPSMSEMRAALSMESKEAIAVLVSVLEKCGSYREEEPFVDLALVPTTAVEWEVLGSVGVKTLTMVGCLAPGQGQIFWRLPAAARLDDILTLLKDDSLFIEDESLGREGSSSSSLEREIPSSPREITLKRSRSSLAGRSRLKKKEHDVDQEEESLSSSSSNIEHDASLGAETETEPLYENSNQKYEKLSGFGILHEEADHSEMVDPFDENDDETVRVVTKRKKRTVTNDDED